MNIWDIVLPVLLFISGFWILERLPFCQEDHLRIMN